MIRIAAPRTRRLALAVASMSVAAPRPAPAQETAGAALPNVVILLADDLGWGDVGYHGAEIRTPNIDRFAREGVRLNHFYVTPVCSPTRAGLLTGRYPLRFGLMRAVIPPWSTYGLPPGEKTLAEMLAEAGYEHRGILGKWHLGHTSLEHHPLNHGFTYFYGHYNGAIDYFTHEREGEVDWHRNYETVHEEGYTTDLLAEDAVRFIRRHADDSPFFLYVPFNAPHSPLQAKEEDLARYPELKGERKRYAAMVDALDQAVGRILEALERHGIAENTLVLFLSDNGGVGRFGGDNGPLRAGKATVYEGGIRVPAIVRWPRGIEGSRQVDALMGYIDLYPTLKRVVGHTAPDPHPLDGVDVLDVIRGMAAAPMRPWFSFLAQQGDEEQASTTVWPWKLVAREDDPLLDPQVGADAEIELYRLDRDPYEQHDLAAEHPRRIEALVERLEAFRGLRVPGVTAYGVGREGFQAPEDWIIGKRTAPDESETEQPAHPAPAQEQPARPNIVLILADDMGFSDIGPYGGEIRTPVLDQLATDGVRFTQFYNTARCTPTRGSLLTGLYPHQAGVGHMPDGYAARVRRIFDSPAYTDHLAYQTPTIAEVLRHAGYTTYMTGKWHLGYEQSQWPVNRGFDRTFALIAGASNYYGHGVQGGGRVGYAPMALDGQPYEPPLEGFFITDAFSDHAARFIREHDDSKPFFLYLAYNAPHWPLHAPAEDIADYRGRYREKGWDRIRAERYARLVEMGLVDPEWELAPRPERVPPWEMVPEEEKEKWDLEMSIYAAQIERMDAGIGRVLQALREKGVEENTLVLFLSDNGGAAEDPNRSAQGAVLGDRNSYEGYGIRGAHVSSAPFRLTKKWVHEGGIATPLIARWPARIEDGGGLRTEPGHLIDLAPTFLELARAEFPREWGDRPALPPEGVSLTSVFAGRELPDRAIFFEHEGNRAVRERRWKLVSEYPGEWELYDMQADRTELNDLSARHPERVRRMAGLYAAWAARVGAKPWELLEREDNAR